MKTNITSLWKKILITALCVIAIAGLVFAGLMCKAYYDKYYKLSYWENWTDYVSKDIVLKHGYKGMGGFEQLMDIRTGEYTTPQLQHIFTNTYNSEDSLVVFRTFDRLRGYLNVSTGNVIIPAKYYMVRMIGDDLFDVEVTCDGEHILINSKGQIVG